MDKLAKGTVKFDTLTVMGRDFIPPVYNHDTGFYDYAFSVEAFVSNHKPKKGQGDLIYGYLWSGHINICLGSARVHLHNREGDFGLAAMEEKLNIVKDNIDFFLKEHKARIKTPAKKVLNHRVWLNGADTRYTGHTAYELQENGSGVYSIADCHKAIQWWVDVYHNPNGKLMADPSREKTLAQLEVLSKGLDKAVKAIIGLRKFFERELAVEPTAPAAEPKPKK